eukprot:6473306-Karenia_brevis.AAC.1
MRQDVRKCYLQGCLPARELQIDWIPLVIPDGHLPGSLVLKRCCAKCRTMPMLDGQWFLFEKHTGKQVWICPICGCIMSFEYRPFCVAFKSGPMSQDFIVVKAEVPTHRDFTLIDIFKVWNNTPGMHTFPSSKKQFAQDEVAGLIRYMVGGSWDGAYIHAQRCPGKNS